MPFPMTKNASQPASPQQTTQGSGPNAELFGTGVALIASALPSGVNPEQRQLLTGAGITIGSILQDRFFQNQAKEWETNELASYKRSSMEFYNQLTTIDIPPDQTAKMAMDWQMQVFDPFMTQTGIKYGKNPYIMTTVLEAKDRWLKGLDQFMGWEDKAWDRSKREETYETNLAGKEAATESQLADVEYKKALTEKTRKETSLVGQEKDPFTDWAIPPQYWGEDFAGMHTTFVNQNLDPKVAQTWDAQTLDTAIKQEIRNRRFSGNPLRPDQRKWGETTAEQAKQLGISSDEDVVQSEFQQDPDKFRRMLEYGRLIKSMPPALAKALHGDTYADVIPFFEGKAGILTPEERIRKNPLVGDVPMNKILTVATGLPETEFAEIETPEDYIENILPEIDDYGKLGPLFADSFQNAVQSTEYGSQLVSRLPTDAPEGGRYTEYRVIETYEDVKTAILMDLHNKINLIVARDPTSRPTRAKLDIIVKALVDKFAPQVVQELNSRRDPKNQIPMPKRRAAAKSKKGIILRGFEAARDLTPDWFSTTESSGEVEL